MSTNTSRVSQVDCIPLPIAEKLGHVVERHQATERLFHIGGLVGICVSLLLVLVIADLVLEIESTGWRITAWLATLGCAALSARWWRRFVRRPLNWVEAAWHVEAIRPDMEERLSSTVEFLGELPTPGTSGQIKRRASLDYSPQLIQALSVEAVGKVSTLRPDDVPVRPSWPVLSLLAVIGTLFLCLVLATPAGVVCSLRNWFMPWATPIFPTLHLDVTPGETTIVEGESIEVRVASPGRWRQPVIDYWAIPPDIATKPLTQLPPLPSIAQGAQQEGLATLENLQANTTYRIREGKRVTRDYHVRVLRKPRIRGITARVEFPDYTELPPEFYAATTAAIPVLVGSTLRLEVDADEHAQLAELLWKSPVENQTTSDRFRFELTLNAPREYSGEIRVTSAEGVDSIPTPIDVQVHADMPPQLQVLEPTLPRFYLSRERKLTVHFTASDDLGIDAVYLLYKPHEAPAVEAPQTIRVDAEPIPESDRRSYRGGTEVGFRDLPVESRAATVWLRAVDNRPEELGGPQHVESQKFVVEFRTTQDSPLEQQLTADQRDIENALAAAREQLENAQSRAAQLAGKLAEAAERREQDEQSDDLLQDALHHTDQSKAALTRLAEALEQANSDLTELVNSTEDLAEQQVANAQQELHRVPLLDKSQAKSERARAAAEELAEALERLQAIEQELQSDLNNQKVAAQLDDLAERQRQLVQELTPAQPKRTEATESAPAGETDEANKQADADESHSGQPKQATGADWRKRQQQVADELRELARQQPETRREVSERQAAVAESLAEQARQLADQWEQFSRHQSHDAIARNDSAESQNRAEPQSQDADKQQPPRGQRKIDRQFGEQLEELQRQAAKLAQESLPDRETQELAKAAEEEFQRAGREVQQALDEQDGMPSESGQEMPGKQPSEDQRPDGPLPGQADKATGKPQGATKKSPTAKTNPAKSLRKAEEALRGVCKSCRECAACQNPSEKPGKQGAGKQGAGKTPPTTRAELKDAQQTCDAAATAPSRQQAQRNAQDAGRKLTELAEQAAQRTGLRKNCPPCDNPPAGKNAAGRQARRQPKGSQAVTDQPLEPMPVRGEASSAWTRSKRKLQNSVLDGREAMIPDAFRDVVTDYFEALAKQAGSDAARTEPADAGDGQRDTSEDGIQP